MAKNPKPKKPARKPAGKKPAGKKPAAKKLTAKKKAAKKPAAKKPTKSGEGEIGKAQRIAIQVLGLKKNSDGMVHSHLIEAVLVRNPKINQHTVVRAVVDLPKDHPDAVVKGEGWGAPYRLKKIVDREAAEEDAEEDAAQGTQTRERSYYKPFRNWLLSEEKCQMAAATGDVRKGKRGKWMIPDVVGKRDRELIPNLTLLPEITSVEIKYGVTWNELIQGFGQACAFKTFSHKTYLVVPQQIKPDYRRLLDHLCELFHVGFVVYDSEVKPEAVTFTEVLRPQPHEPDHDELKKINDVAEWKNNGKTLETYIEDEP